MELQKFSEKIYQKLLSEKTNESSEKAILWIALVSFIIHNKFEMQFASE